MTADTTGVSLDTAGLVDPQCSITAVEDSAPQVIDSPSPLDEFAAPVYNHFRQELFVAEETTVHEPATVPKFSELKNRDTMIDSLSTLKDLGVQMENIELLADQAAKGAMTMTSAPREAVPWKRREVIPTHQIM